MFGEHAAYIVPSYLITLAVFATLVVYVRYQYAVRKRQLSALQEQGIRRRSEKADS